jgi:adenylate cyclase class IV
MLEIKAQVLFNVSGIITYIAFIAKKGNHDWHIKLREYQPSAITIITTTASVLAQSVSKRRTKYYFKSSQICITTASH